MNVSILLIILFAGAFANNVSAVTNWRQSSIVLCLSSLGFSIVLLTNVGENISVIHQWINQPNISFAQADGLSIAMISTQSLTPIIIFSS
jgi:NADH-quinone oxidoreductase subunit M